MKAKKTDALKLVEISGGTLEDGSELTEIILHGSPTAARAVAHLFLQEVRLSPAAPDVKLVGGSDA